MVVTTLSYNNLLDSNDAAADADNAAATENVSKWTVILSLEHIWTL